MANKTIKGLTVEIGGDTTKLGEALADVEKKGRSLSSELGSINRLLKLDPGNTELLAQKQKVLADAVGNTREKLDKLKEAEKQVQAQFEKGEASEEQVRELQREIIATTKKLEGYESAAQQASKAVKDVGDESKDTEKDTKKLSDTLEKVGKVGLMGLVGAATAAIGALVGCVEATEEYRREMGKLETAFETAGSSAETAYETYSDLQGVLGESDQAVEAANHLAKLTTNEQELNTMTKALTGVYATFGVSLPVEGLAEAANETKRTGTVTGGLADALNWAAKEGETFGVKMKEATKENEEWNKAVEAATTAEDYFNLALQECSDEQERQQLIIETLSDLYGDAAEAYEETNAEVIASNKATERLNKVWADVGKKAAPIVTTFKEGIADLGEALVESLDDADVEKFQNTIKKGFTNLSQNVLPKLISALEWVIDNLGTLSSLAAGFFAAMAVGKIVSIATTIGTTLVSAIQAATSAQKGLNAAASANPYVLLAQAIIAVGTAIAGLVQNHFAEMKEEARLNAEQIYGLSKAEKEAADRANEAAEAFRNQRDALNESVAGTESQFSYLGSLKDELLKLADASGKVKEKDQARAKFILEELNQALGTEYTLTGNQINNYKELAASIDKVMEKKKAELLLEATAESYVQALKNKSQAEQDYYNSLYSYMDTKALRDQKLKEAREAYAEYEEAVWIWEKQAALEKSEQANAELRQVQENLNTQKAAYEDNKETLQGYYDTIGQYESGHTQLLKGNTEEASKILSDLGYYYDNYAADVGYASDEVQNRWELDVIDAGLKAQHIKDNWEKGVDGYTEDQVQEAKEGYAAMIKAYANAHKDAVGVGEDLGDGLEQGMANKESPLVTKAKSLVNGIIAAFRKAADSHSPSRKMIAFGEDMGEGGEIGLENKTKDLEKAATRQVNAVLDAYNGQDRNASKTLSGIAERQAAIQAQSYQSAANGTAARLDLILEAIKAGQLIVLDGDAVVGGTADRYNNKLGQIQLLTERGAL